MFMGNIKVVDGKEYIDKLGHINKTRPTKWFEHKCDGCGGLHWVNARRHYDICRRNGGHFCSWSCRKSHLVGERHQSWKGGTSIINGYVEKYVPQPGARGKYTLEHRLIMEGKLGRKLLPTETVHHRNNIKTDNRIENLELWESRHCVGGRKSDLIAELEALRNENIRLKALLNKNLNKKPRSAPQGIKYSNKEDWGVWAETEEEVGAENAVKSTEH